MSECVGNCVSVDVLYLLNTLTEQADLQLIVVGTCNKVTVSAHDVETSSAGTVCECTHTEADGKIVLKLEIHYLVVNYVIVTVVYAS